MIDDRPSQAVLREVPLRALSLAPFETLLGGRAVRELRAAAVQARGILAGRTFWNVNSTAAGGGVAEMLQTLVGYARGAGVDARWLVISGNPEFFAITKRLHNALHGAPGDGGTLGPVERRHYERTLAPAADALRALVRPTDVVMLHDPQTIGLVPALREVGAHVIWRCHIGYEQIEGLVRAAWEFLDRWLHVAHALVFSRAAYAPASVPRTKLRVVAPSIDVFAVKNREMSPETVRAILGHIGLIARNGARGVPGFTRQDGTAAVIARTAKVACEGPRPGSGVPLVVQVSRWDRLKDMAGVMQGFVEHVAPSVERAHLALVGPDTEGVADDPEGAATFEECLARWRALPPAMRRRVSLVRLPMDDGEENAGMVNAIQRHAAVVVQKSLREGFGLTVTEAMWKGRPIVASAVGGIQDQIRHRTEGLLVRDPADLRAFGCALRRLLEDERYAQLLGARARRRCIRHFLPPRHLRQYVELLTDLAEA